MDHYNGMGLAWTCNSNKDIIGISSLIQFPDPNPPCSCMHGDIRAVCWLAVQSLQQIASFDHSVMQSIIIMVCQYYVIIGKTAI